MSLLFIFVETMHYEKNSCNWCWNAGTTTAYALVKKGHNVTIIDSRRYPAMATSYANGGQLSASNAETWNTTKNVVSGIKWMPSDAPLLFNPSPEIQKYRWMLGFLWTTLR